MGRFEPPSRHLARRQQKLNPGISRASRRIARKAMRNVGGDPRPIGMTLWQYPRDPAGITRTISVPRNGKWTPVPPRLGTVAVPVFREPASPRHATQSG
jgi:hypothetical protein